MITKLFSLLHKQFTWKKIVAFFGSLGIIVSAVLTISQLVSPEPQGNQKPIVLTDSGNGNSDRVITQGNKTSAGDKNINTWIENKKEINVKNGGNIKQGDQSTVGDHNVNTWNNSGERSK